MPGMKWLVLTDTVRMLPGLDLNDMASVAWLSLAAAATSGTSPSVGAVLASDAEPEDVDPSLPS